MKANSKHYILIVLGLATVVLAAFGYWYVYSTTISQAQKHSLLEQEIGDNEQNNKVEINLLNISSSTKDKRLSLQNYLVSEDKILDFIKSIENISSSSSTKITLSSISDDDLSDQKEGSTGKIKLHVDVVGSWTNVNKTLVLIENLPYSISIESVTMSISMANLVNMPAEIVINKTSTKTAGLNADKIIPITKRENIWNLSFDVSALTVK